MAFLEIIKMNGDELLKIDGFDEAVIGVQQSIEPKLVYDIDKMALILVTEDEMNLEDAYDHISYNLLSTEHAIIIKICSCKDFEDN